MEHLIKAELIRFSRILLSYTKSVIGGMTIFLVVSILWSGLSLFSRETQVLVGIFLILLLLVATGRGRSLRGEFVSVLWRLRCAFYVAWWGTKHKVSSVARAVSKFALAVVALFVLVASQAQYHLYGTGTKWLEGPAQWVLLIAALIVFSLHWQEWRTQRQGFAFVKSMDPLFDSIGHIALESKESRRDAVMDFVLRVLAIVHETFKDKMLTKVNIMIPLESGKLTIRWQYPTGTSYDPSFEPTLGLGGAGVSFSETTIVYIPAVKYKHGVTIKLPEYRGDDIRSATPPGFGFRPGVYAPVSHKRFEAYSSILSVPITGPLGTLGVLNLDSAIRNGFDDHDAHVANAYARALGVVLSLCPDALHDEGHRVAAAQNPLLTATSR